MLNREKGWAESTLTEIEFKDDDPDPFPLVLQVAHLDLKSSGTRVDNDLDLFCLALLCDKYDTVTLVRPFIPGWVKAAKEQKQQSHPFDSYSWLLISFIFGLHAVFAEHICHVLFTMRQHSVGLRSRF